MQINSCSSTNTNFGKLYIRSNKFYDISEKSINQYQDKLSKTKYLDVIIDSHGIAIKEKMTENLSRIQSFSLFTLENAVGINFNGDKKNTFKFSYPSFEEAKKAWLEFSEITKNDFFEGYCKIALWMDKHFKNNIK